MDLDDHRDAAMRDAADMQIQMIRSGVVPSPGMAHPSDSMEKWIEHHCRSRLESGKVLTPIMHLTGGYSVAAKECLFGQGPYRDLGVMVRLKNIGPSRLKLLTEIHVRYESKPVVRSGGITVSVAGRKEKYRFKKVYLEPGEEIELEAERAGAMLYKYNQSAYEPSMWGESGAIPQRDELEEVGYSVMRYRDDEGNFLDSRNFAAVDQTRERKRKSA